MATSASSMTSDGSLMTSSSQFRSASSMRLFLITCLATNAQIEREVMRMESSLSFHNTRMKLIFANSPRTKFKSGMLEALAMWWIAVKHTTRAPLRTSSPGSTAPVLSIQLRKRTKSGCRRTIFPDLVGGMRSMTLCLGMLAANARNLFLSPSERCLNSQVIVLRSSSSSGFVAPLMTLFGKLSVRYLSCASTALPSVFDKPGSNMYCSPDPAPYEPSGLSEMFEPSETSESCGTRHAHGHGHRHEHPRSRFANRKPKYATRRRK